MQVDIGVQVGLVAHQFTEPPEASFAVAQVRWLFGKTYPNLFCLQLIQNFISFRGYNNASKFDFSYKPVPRKATTVRPSIGTSENSIAHELEQRAGIFHLGASCPSRSNPPLKMFILIKSA